jgi:regulator of sigma E protease
MSLSSILRCLFIIAEVVLFYNLIICVHELGHFWAARWRGLVIEKFAIWMGPALWKRRINGVEYCLGSIPAGGYVALPQMAPMESIEGKAGEDGQLVKYPPIKPLDKIIVAFAGPLASFSFALVCACLIWWIGRPVTEMEATTVIGYVEKDSPAAQGGLLPGDRILEIDGYPITRFIGMGSDAVLWRIVSSEGETIDIKVDRQGQTVETRVKPRKEPRKFFQRPSLRSIQVMPSVIPLIDDTMPNSPAARAGLKSGDEVIAINGEKLYHAHRVIDYIGEHPGESLVLSIRRREQTFDVTVKPEVPVGGDKPYVGIYWNLEGRTFLAYPKPFEQVISSIDTMVNTLGALFSPKSDIGPQQLNGPVKIMHVYYNIFDGEQPWRRVLWFSVLININLAVLNLFPIPVLDGGHITMAILEKIRGRPHNEQVLEYIMTGCAAMVIGFIVYVTFFDVQDLPFWNKPAPPPKEIRFASPDTSAKP